MKVGELAAQFCMDHWNELRKAIADHGMQDLVAGSSKELMSRLGQNEGDPLMDAHMFLTKNIMAIMDEVFIQGSQKCPICAIKEFDWIAKAVDGSARVYLRKN